jgi:hypothetical protein
MNVLALERVKEGDPTIETCGREQNLAHRRDSERSGGCFVVSSELARQLSRAQIPHTHRAVRVARAERLACVRVGRRLQRRHLMNLSTIRVVSISASDRAGGRASGTDAVVGIDSEEPRRLGALYIAHGDGAATISWR